jgi:hypothetical protein
MGPKKGSGAVGSGIVEKNIQPTKLSPEVLEKGFYLRGVGEVGLEGFGDASFPANGLGELEGGCLAAAVMDSDGITLAGEFQG